MRSVRILRWALVPAVLATLAIQPGASASQGADWSGQTRPQGRPLTFAVSQEGTRTVITEMAFAFSLTCQDGERVDLEVSFGGFHVPIVNKRFSFVYAERDQALQWKGRFDTPVHASGTVRTAIPALTRSVHAQVCSSGVQRFTAHPAAAGAGRPFHPDVRLTVTKDASGNVRLVTAKA
jgi:hypothetical protein